MSHSTRNRSQGLTWVYNGLTVKMTPIHMEPTTQYNGRRRVWRLLQSFSLDITSTKSPYGVMHQCFELPAGFLSDFASMPSLSEVILGGRDDFLISSLVHDAMCNEHLPAFITNATMRIIMAAEGITWWRRTAIFYTLMLFGYGSPIYRMCGHFGRKKWRRT